MGEERRCDKRPNTRATCPPCFDVFRERGCRGCPKIGPFNSPLPPSNPGETAAQGVIGWQIQDLLNTIDHARRR